MKVTYDKVQFDAAVSYVWAYNHLTSSDTREDCESLLLGLIKRGANSKTTYTSCGGFTVIFACDSVDSDAVCAEITVDATFRDCNYITVEL